MSSHITWCYPSIPNLNCSIMYKYFCVSGYLNSSILPHKFFVNPLQMLLLASNFMISFSISGMHHQRFLFHCTWRLLFSRQQFGGLLFHGSLENELCGKTTKLRLDADVSFRTFFFISITWNLIKSKSKEKAFSSRRTWCILIN